ncbi:MAG: acyltransferase family protein [Prosthecobacter sp.]
MPYIASLDGIRALAILAVLIFHVSPASLRGGFTGVDVFFVLSGFLITSILLRDLQKGAFSMREFYLRRIQRLLPNSLLMLITVLALWAALMSPHTAMQTGWHALWAVMNLSNVYIWKNLGGYWGDSAEWAPLTHTWSLGIEEQFYLLFPAALLWLTRRQPRRMVAWLTGALLVSFSLCLIGTWHAPLATFYLLPTRGWELLLGAVLAACFNPLASSASPRPAFKMAPQLREAGAWLGLALIVGGFLGVNETMAFPGLVALAPTVGTALLLLSIVAGETRVSRLLSTPVMAVTGKLSYSLYLWHWPLIIMGRTQAEIHGFSPLAGAAAGGALGCALACAAYVWVECPLRQPGAGRTWRLKVVTAGFAAVLLGSAFLTTRSARTETAAHFDLVTFHGELYDVVRPAEGVENRGTRYHDVHFPPVPPRAKDIWRTGGIRHEHGAARPQVVVLGSSHALMYARLIDDICRGMGLTVAFLCADSTPAFFVSWPTPGLPTPEAAREFDAARKRWLQEWRPEAVIIVDKWDQWEPHGSGFVRKVRTFLKEVTPLAGRVLWVTQPPVIQGGAQLNMRDLAISRMRSPGHLPRLEADALQKFRQYTVTVAETLAATFPNVSVLRADRLFDGGDGTARYAEGRAFYYADDDHLSDQGTEVARSLFHAALTEAHASANADMSASVRASASVVPAGR